MAVLTPADIPFDVGYVFDDGLREVPNNPEAMVAAVDWLVAQAKETAEGSQARATISSLLGVYCRIIGQLDEAESYLVEAISTFASGQQVEKHFVAKLRLATVLQWQRRFEEADGMVWELDKASIAEPRLESYRHFVWQHRGKSAFDQERYIEARDDFARSLVERRAKGLQDLIKASEFSLGMATKLIKV